jgi:hypothetical protein
LRDEIKKYGRTKVEFKWIPRNQNKAANHLATLALDKSRKSSS